MRRYLFFALRVLVVGLCIYLLFLPALGFGDIALIVIWLVITLISLLTSAALLRTRYMHPELMRAEQELYKMDPDLGEGPRSIKELNQYPRSIKELKLGYVNYLVNETMKNGIAETVKAEVFLDRQNLETIQDMRRVERLHVAKKMSAKLICKTGKFEIISLNRDVQPVLDLDITTWKWDVKPLRSGRGSLELILSVAIAVKGMGIEMKDLETYRKDVAIKINPAYSTKLFFNNNWQWLVGLLVGSGTLFSVLKAVGIIH